MTLRKISKQKEEAEVTEGLHSIIKQSFCLEMNISSYV